MEDLSEQQSNEKETELFDAYRKEIEEYAVNEMQERKTAHFSFLLESGEKFKPEDLTKEDLLFWGEVKQGIVTERMVRDYRLHFQQSNGKQNSSRHGFCSLAINRASGIIGWRWLEEEKKKK